MMNIEFVYKQQILNLPYIDREMLQLLTDREAKALIALYTCRDELSLAEALGLEQSETAALLHSLEEKGLIRLNGESAAETAEKTEKAKPIPPSADKKLLREELPHYSGEDIDRIFSQKSTMRALVDECARIVGKLLNPLETNKIVSMSDYLRLDDAFILLLFQYCVSQGKKSIAYIEKTAFNLVSEECDTLPKLEAYIRRKEELRSMEGQIRRLLGIGERSLTAKEKEYFAKWGGADGWGFSFEMIACAYEATVDTIGKKSLPYTDRILENWHRDGIATPEQVQAASEAHRQASEQQRESENKPSFDTDDFFADALKRSYEAIEKKNEKKS
ncbi:MAG: DnaD domain protein [Ruminococcaceae bacterium]|nr:DnaD domain protein [Oscillospiraceae bacterium]